MSDTWVDNLLDGIANAKLGKRYGNITQIIGLVIESAGPTASIGELCYIKNN